MLKTSLVKSEVVAGGFAHVISSFGGYFVSIAAITSGDKLNFLITCSMTGSASPEVHIYCFTVVAVLFVREVG